MLSITINVKNGAKYLSRCLNALSKFNDVVVLDNYSTDETCEIASKYKNVRLFQSEFVGMGRVRNQVATYAKYDWILCVDCDEILHPDLTNQLLQMEHKNEFIDNSIYKIKRYNYYDNFRLDGASWGNDKIPRLYNRKQTKFIENEVHDSFLMDGMTVRLIDKGFIYHFPYDTVAGLIDKMQFYSGLYAKQHYLKKRPKLYNIPFRALMMFIKCYILKRGFMYGYEGLTISIYNAIGVFSKYIKLYELGYKQKFGLGISGIQNFSQLKLAINYVNKQTLLPHIVFILFDDSMLNKHQASEINNLILQDLVVEAKIIGISNQDPASVINLLLLEHPNLDLMASVDYIDILDDPHLLKKCKGASWNNTQIAGVNFTNQVSHEL